MVRNHVTILVQFQIHFKSGVYSKIMFTFACVATAAVCQTVELHAVKL